MYYIVIEANGEGNTISSKASNDTKGHILPLVSSP